MRKDQKRRLKYQEKQRLHNTACRGRGWFQERLSKGEIEKLARKLIK